MSCYLDFSLLKYLLGFQIQVQKFKRNHYANTWPKGTIFNVMHVILLYCCFFLFCPCCNFIFMWYTVLFRWKTILILILILRQKGGNILVNLKTCCDGEHSRSKCNKSLSRNSTKNVENLPSCLELLRKRLRHTITILLPLKTMTPY